MIGCIYKITNLINNKVYIGKTTRGFMRIRSHLICLKKNIHKNTHLQRSWNKHGEQNFKNEIIYSDVPKNLLNFLEISVIAWYNSTNDKFGFNKTEGGEGGDTLSFLNDELKNLRILKIKTQMNTLETKLKSSQSQKGKKASEETKRKQSESGKIAQNRPEVKAICSIARLGMKDKPETLEKKRLANLGSKNPMYGIISPVSFKALMIKHNCTLEEAKVIRKQMMTRKKHVVS